ncbi:hypothetical protein [Fusibacter sp. 3D3]|uniref:hypothetical protein n=1 Tax=Fusibacter sp. 3D3 TaxID=1048380 RepID=UPI0008537B5F|nr:hypothetical protein [Fusibacter sp. 3D3]GAU77695.1 hypothetical protein F3D3_2324 [Fusibacter sp. 3D3]
MKKTIENLVVLSERAEPVRVETDALLTAVRTVMCKENSDDKLSQIPEKWQAQYRQQVNDKIRLIQSKRRGNPEIA